MPKPKKKLFLTTVVDRATYDKAKRLAKREDRTVAAMIRRLIDKEPEEVAQATGS